MHQISELPAHIRLEVVQLGPHNSSNNERGGKPWVTVARLWDITNTANPELVLQTKARCSRNDTPRRKTGYKIAVGRLLERYFEPERYDSQGRLRKEVESGLGYLIDRLPKLDEGLLPNGPFGRVPDLSGLSIRA